GSVIPSGLTRTNFQSWPKSVDLLPLARAVTRAWALSGLPAIPRTGTSAAAPRAAAAPRTALARRRGSAQPLPSRCPASLGGNNRRWPRGIRLNGAIAVHSSSICEVARTALHLYPTGSCTSRDRTEQLLTHSPAPRGNVKPGPGRAGGSPRPAPRNLRGCPPRPRRPPAGNLRGRPPESPGPASAISEAAPGTGPAARLALAPRRAGLFGSRVGSHGVSCCWAASGCVIDDRVGGLVTSG